MKIPENQRFIAEWRLVRDRLAEVGEVSLASGVLDVCQPPVHDRGQWS